jgi:hypothetical protein
MALKYSTTARNNKLGSLNTDIGTSCKIRIYSGSRPANVGTAISGQTLLAELIGNASGFGTTSGGVLTASAISSASASAGGTASFFRIFKSDGTTAVVDGDVGTSGSDLNLNNTSIASGQTVSISSFTITDNNG